MSSPASKIAPRFLEVIEKAGGHVYEVGGSVRDRLLGIPKKDLDLLVTHLAIKDLTTLLRPLGEIFLVGKSFGVIKFHPKEGGEIDIALPRKEVSTGEGHRDFDVHFDPLLPVEIDLSRRDFTVNAMAQELSTGRMIDPFGGQTDLRDKKLRMVSQQAFLEDPLRMLRGIQFAARFHLEIEPDTFASMKEHAEKIKTVSSERITEEIKKLLSAEQPSQGFILMEKAGLLGYVFPELQATVGVEQGNKFRNDDVFMHTMRVLDASRKDNAIPNAGDMELMLAALYHDVGKPKTKRFDPEKNRLTFYGHQILSKRMVRKRIQALKMTTLGIDSDRVEKLVEEHMFQAKSFFSDRAIRRFINKIGPDLILKLVDLRLADNRGGRYPEGIRGVLRLREKIEHEINNKSPFSVKDLAIRGTDLMSIGLREGPQMGLMLKELVEVVLDEPEKNTPEILLEIARTKLSTPQDIP